MILGAKLYPYSGTFKNIVLLSPSMNRRLKVIVFILCFLLILIILNSRFPILKSPEAIRTLLLELGIRGYFLFIAIVGLSGPLPIPTTPFTIAGGYVYGVILGSILNYIGILISATLSFYLIRHFGRPLLKKMVASHHIVHFKHIFASRGNNAVLIAYAIPVFPSDTISLLLGLSQMKYRHFIVLVIVGHIPRLLLGTYLGSELTKGFTPFSLALLGFSSIFILIVVFREKIKKFIFKELRVVEAVITS